MKKQFFIFSLFWIFILNLNAQSSIIVEGIILDAKTKTPLEQVNIFNQTSITGNSSELDGTFKIEVTQYPTVLIFSYVGYENYLLEIKELPQKPFTILLQHSSFGLPEIEITAEPKIEKLTKKEYTVKDFLIIEQQILILTYGSIRTGNTLILQNWEGDILYELKLGKGHVERLEKSCLGSVHVIGRKYGFEISLLANQIQLVSKYPAQQFEELMEPCVASSDEFIYWKDYAYKNQFLTYIVMSKEEKDIIKKIRIADELNITRSKDDFVLQKQLAEATGFGKPTATEIQSWNQLMYKPIYAPLFQHQGELYLFNHINGYLEFYSLKGDILRYLPITYQKHKNWSKQILFDKKKNKVYTVFNTKKGKAFHEINLKDGTTSPALFLDCVFVEKMEIYNGFLFYTESGISEVNRVLHRVEIES